MLEWVSKEAIRAARRVNLYDFLLSRHRDGVALEGDSLRLREDHSVSIKQGYTGYTDFADDSTGNSIDCLVRYFGYTLQEAVEALCRSAGIPIDIPDPGPDMIDLDDLDAPAPARPPAPIPSPGPGPPKPEPPPHVFEPPDPVQGPYARLFAYLGQRRGIPAWLIQALIDQGLLYQDRDHGNAVFINRELQMAEVHGTTDRPFHGTAKGSSPSGFWAYRPGGPDMIPDAAYVCEAAIDAISLYLLLARDPHNKAGQAMYCSIGGVANRDRVAAIRSYMDAAGDRTILAFDNDEAGRKWLQAYPDCWTAVPIRKDWNEDWLAARPPPGS